MDRSAWAAQAALALCGFSAVVGQITLMRELIQVFNGNEISLGVGLGTWLLWTAAGSGLAGAATMGWRRPRLAVAALECLLAASLPATIWVLRGAKGLFQAVPGELLGPLPMILTSVACLSVFCATSGALFVAAVRLVAVERGLSAGEAAGAGYLFEAGGSALGGIIASLLLVRFCEAFQIAVIVGLMNFSLAVGLGLRLRRGQIASLAGAAPLIAIPLLVCVAPRWDAEARGRLWRGFNVVGEHESIYGSLTVTETGGEGGRPVRSIYENGAIVANAPDPAAAEEGVHYALLEHPVPRRVLLIGGGVNGGVAEALKYPTVEQLDYVELDPTLIAMTRKFFPEQSAAFDSDPRVHLHFLDGRLFLAESRDRFDVIVVDVPDPQTAQLNRFYTAEFFRMARAHLENGGLVAVKLRSSEEWINPDLAEFLRSNRRTMREVFPYQATIPGETVHIFGAMQPNVLTDDPNVLIARLHERRIDTQYVREYFIPYRMTPDRMKQLDTALAPTAATPVNRDFAPVAYAFDVVLWSAQFKSGYADWFRAAEHVEFGKVAGALGIALLVCMALLTILPGCERCERTAAGVCVAATGFTMMALQIFLLLGFQAVYGYVYSELAILIGLFMGGIALGSWLAIRQSTTANKWRLTQLQFVVAAAGPMLLTMLVSLSGISSTWAARFVAQLIFPAMAALAGMSGGYQFVVAAGIYLRERGGRSGLGILYAIDLLGGCFGALLLSVFLIPVFGFWKTAWLGVAINAAAVLVATRASLEKSAARV